MRRLATCVAAVLALFIYAAPAFAVLPDEQLSDPKLEARARAISQELRCVQCQNETIDDSDAPIAHDLRVILRERLKAGDTDDQAIGFVVKRYGSYVLLRPPFRAETLLLWLGPLLVLLAGGAGAFIYMRNRARAAASLPARLTPDEQAALDKMLYDGPVT